MLRNSRKVNDMKKITKYYKRLRISYIRTALFVILLNILFLPNYAKVEPDGENFFHITLNGKSIGSCGKGTDVEELLREARMSVAKDSEDIVYVEAELTVEGESVDFAAVDSEQDLKQKMETVLKESKQETLKRAYTVKIKNYTLNLASSEDVKTVLQAALDQYEENRQYTVELVMDPTRELNALTAIVEDNSVEKKAEVEPFPNAGFEAHMEDALATVKADDGEVDFSDIDYGLTSLAYGDDIEVVDTYMMEEKLTPVSEAVAQITSVEEKNAIYVVQSGDTLSEISENVNIDMDKIISLNDAIENELSVIRVGQEIIITQPEPPLSVERQEQVYYEEDYEADIVYVDNDDWYTTEEVTLQEPSAGHRKVAVLVSYRNDKEVSREILKEEVVMEAVPKIVEKGTKIPPSYIKPINGGRLTSTFGGRRDPITGRSSSHSGTDWAVPKGTAVYASSGGTVTKASWGGSYGNVIYIKHPDGRETRYAHLSKILVSTGQTVKQGQKIALSGNTGRSTGPHLHFEIRINGSPVNALKYIQ